MNRGGQYDGPQGGQRIGGGPTVQLNLSRAFLSRHERPPSGPGTTVVVGVGGTIGSLLQAAPVSCIVAACGLVRAGVLANFGHGGIVGLLFGQNAGAAGSSLKVAASALVEFFSNALPPPFSLLSFTPTRPNAGFKTSPASGRRAASFAYDATDTTADTVTVICITLLIWWLGRPAERRWGPGRFLTYLIVGYVASLCAFFLVTSAGLAANLTLGASLWMSPAIALLLNTLTLRSSSLSSSSSSSMLQSILTNAASMRGIAGISLLSYALMLNVTGGLLGSGSSAGAHHYASSARYTRSNGASTSSNAGGVSIAAASAAIVPFVVAGVLQFIFASPSGSHNGAETSDVKTKTGLAGDKSPLPPQSAKEEASRRSTPLISRMQSVSKRFLYAFVCPRIVQPILFRLVYTSSSARADSSSVTGDGSNNNNTKATDASKSSSTPSYRCFQRRVITRLEEIGYTRAGTLMSDEEELLYAAQLHGLVPLAAQRPNHAAAANARAQANLPPAAPAARQPEESPLTEAQQEKINTLLAIGLPNVTAESIRHALESVGWDMDTAMTLLIEQ